MTQRERKIDHTWYLKPAGARERVSAGGIVVRHDGTQFLIALVREGDITSYVLPKGGVKEGEDLERAARREISEEAGLSSLALIEPLGVEERLSYGKECWQITHYFLFTTRQAVGRPTDAGHHGGPWWYSLDELPPMLWPEQWELIVSCRERIQSLPPDTGGEVESPGPRATRKRR